MKKISKRKTKQNKHRVQANNSNMCGYVCIGFIDFMLKGKSLQDHFNFFSPNEYEKNGKTNTRS